LYCLQNPAHHLQPRAIQQVVRYQVALGEWQSAAQKEPFPPS
jgi:hypothetical protein